MKRFFTSLGYLLLLFFLSECKKEPDTVTQPPIILPPVASPNYSYGSESVHLTLGNPSQANDNSANLENYLLLKAQFVVCYNNKEGKPKWVAWHLGKGDLGSAERQDDFQPDRTLPLGYNWIKPTDYTSTYGFDRGHMCPSADRTSTTISNSATFLMTNITPQSPALNRGLWQELEAYCREFVYDGNELYIYSGGYGTGGDSPKGRFQSIANGKITVPERLYKIVLVLPEGDNDLKRIDSKTTVIVIDVPNSQSVQNQGWEDYITTISEIEKKTGLNFLQSLAVDLSARLKSSKYSIPVTTSSPASGTSTPPQGDKASGFHDEKQLFIGPKGGCYYINSNGNKTYVDRSECKC